MRKGKLKESKMNINEEYAIELLLAGHLKGRSIGDGYIVAFMQECQITNPEKLDRWLLNNDYLRIPTTKESISRYKVIELKEMLSKKEIKTSGSKTELIERIMLVLSEKEIEDLIKSDDRYFLSEKGLNYYYANIDLYELHRNWKFRIQLNEFFKYRKSNGIIRNFYETAYLVLKERMEKGNMDMANPYRLTNFDFFNFSEICEKLEMNIDAIKSILIKLYFDTNLVNSTQFPFDKDMIEINGVEKLCSRLQDIEIFNPYTTQKIVSLSEYYSEYMVDDIYDNIKLQYVVFDKKNFKLAIDDMIQSAYFEKLPYMHIIKDNYRYIANKILKDQNTVSFSSILKFLRGK